jgi:hypothetical protein
VTGRAKGTIRCICTAYGVRSIPRQVLRMRRDEREHNEGLYGGDLGSLEGVEGAVLWTFGVRTLGSQDPSAGPDAGRGTLDAGGRVG